MQTTSDLSRTFTLQALYWIIAVSFILITFIVDLSVPSGITIGIAYLFPLFLAIFLIDNKRAPIILSLFCCLLVIMAMTLPETGGEVEFWKEVTNRILSMVFILFGTTFVVLYKNSLQQIYWSERKMTAALNGAPNGVLIVNTWGIITFANQTTEELFGYERGELVGTKVDLLVPKEYRIQHEAYRREFTEHPEVRAMGAGRDLYGVKKDGSQVPVEIGLTPLFISGQLYVMSSIVDITERKKHEEALRQLNKDLVQGSLEKESIITELRRSNQELDDFAYIASHDLKEPLRGIFNNARFLQEDYGDKLDAEGVRRLERLQYLSHRMENLVNDLLYFSRLGRHKLAVQEADLNEVINDITSMMETVLQEQNAQIKLVTPLPRTICDRTRVTEVFRNLISNGVKYNNKVEKVIEIGWLKEVEKDGHKINNVFFVKDNGMGIPPEFHQEIFRIFKRLNEEDESKKGTGVGLTFVRKIIERHGGLIWLESEENEGTIFYFTLNKGDTVNEHKYIADNFAR